MIIYLQHQDEKPVRVVVKDKEKYAQYKKAGVVQLKGRDYQIIEGDIRDYLIFWQEPVVEKAPQVTWDEMRARVKHFKMYGSWPSTSQSE